MLVLGIRLGFPGKAACALNLQITSPSLKDNFKLKESGTLDHHKEMQKCSMNGKYERLCPTFTKYSCSMQI